MDLSLRWFPLLPGWVIVLLLIGLAAAIAFGTAVLQRRGVSRSQLGLVSLLRVLCLVAFALILLQPSLFLSGSEKELPEMLVLVDRSDSMALPSGAPQLSRWQQANGWLGSGSFGSALKSRFRMHRQDFDVTAHPHDANAEKGPAGSTRLAESLEAGCLYQRSLGHQIDRVLLVSDGCDHGLADAMAAARNLGVRVDVLPATSAAPSTPDTIELQDVQGARRVLLGSETHFRAQLAGSRPAKEDRKVTLRFSENGKPVGERAFVLKAGQREQSFAFAHRPESAGLKTYDFQLVAGQDKTPPLQRSLDVIDKTYEVLILEDTWRWEYKYLHRLFEDDPSYRFTALLARGGNSFVQFASPDRRVKLIGFPQNQSELERFDLIFLGDVVPSRWPAGLPAALSRLVTQEGKSLVVIAGPQLGQFAGFPELHKLLPVEVNQDSSSPREGPIEVRQRPEAVSSPFFFQIRAGDKLPAVDRVYPALRKRPGATVLLEAAGQRNPYGNLIVLAEQTVGRGRVLFVGTDTLWKWHTLASTGEGPTPYATFWQQSFRALSPERTSVQNTQLWLVPGRSRIEAGQPVAVEATVQAGRPLPNAVIQASVTLPDQSRLPLVFAADSADPYKYRAEFASSSKGPHTISAQLMVENQVAAEATVSLQVEEAGQENRDAEVDLSTLTRLADGTGGQVVDPEQPETWPQPPEQTERQVPRVRTVDLWNNFTLLFLLTGLLAVDWFVRIFKGLV